MGLPTVCCCGNRTDNSVSFYSGSGPSCLLRPSPINRNPWMESTHMGASRNPNRNWLSYWRWPGCCNLGWQFALHSQHPPRLGNDSKLRFCSSSRAHISFGIVVLLCDGGVATVLKRHSWFGRSISRMGELFRSACSLLRFDHSSTVATGFYRRYETRTGLGHSLSRHNSHPSGLSVVSLRPLVFQ